MFDRTELRLALLKLIADEPRHGYDLIKAIEELTSGEYAPSPGVIYPTLQMMVDEGVIAELPDDSSRKVFEATDAGREELAKEEETVSALFERLSQVGEHVHSAPNRQLHRAMENLRNAMRHQREALREGREDMLDKVVEVLDEAARKIERL
jgi:DNA-binding PadR family transcriptional regulator